MKNKTLCAIALALVLAVLLAVPVGAHSGRTDSAGGHYNHSTGEYHYHHGYPAHQHTNGVCPYSDRYSNTSGSSGSSGSSSSNNASAIVDQKNDQSKKEASGLSWSSIIAIVILCVFVLFTWGGMLWMWIVDIYERIKKRYKSK